MKKIFNLENLAYLTIFALPAYLLRFDIFGFPTNVWEALSIIFILILMRRYFAGAFRRGIPAGGVEKKYLFPVFLIFLGLLFSALASGNCAAGFGIIKSWFLIPALFSWAVFNAVKKEKSINIFWALYFSSFLAAVVSLGYYFSGFLTYDGRLRGFFNSPNYLAMFLAPGLTIGSVFLLKGFLRHKTRLFLAPSFLIVLFCFYKTYSYAGWLSVFGAVFLAMFLAGKIKFKHALMAVAVLLSVLFLQRGSEKFNDLVSFGERSSLASRSMIWRSAGKILGDNWILGIGPGNFQKKYLEYQKYYPPYLEWSAPHPHNVYLTFWLYGGILGIVGFLWLVFLFWKDFFGKTGRPETRHCLVSTGACVSFSIVVYFLLHGLFDTTYFKNDLAVVFWLAYLGGVANKNSVRKN